mgnify:CR=1 FL=1
MKDIIWPGCRVLNTRPLAQAQKLNDWITKAGGIAVSCPMLTIQSTPYAQWLPSLPNLEKIDQAIFTSSNAVKFFFAAFHNICTHSPSFWPPTIKIIAIGKATAAMLAEYGLMNVTVPPISTSEQLIELPSLKLVQNQSILLVKGIGGRDLIATTLRQRGVNLISVDVYQRQKPATTKKYLQHLWRENGIDMIILTSKEAMQNLVALLGREALPWLRGKPCLVISQRLAECAKEIGMQHITILPGFQGLT